MRRCAPGRARSESQRTGSFGMGHEKQGGRMRGTPNLLSADYKKALVEAAYRVGYDGNGKDGVLGYFVWVAQHHPRIYALVLLVNALSLQVQEGNTPEELWRRAEDQNQAIREYIGFTGKNWRQTVQAELPSPAALIGQDLSVGSLMYLATRRPKDFCMRFALAFLRQISKQLRAEARHVWPRAQ